MDGTAQGFSRTRGERGPAIYFGYCGRTGRYRMMDLPEYVSNVQDGVSRWMNDTSAAYQEMWRNARPGTPTVERAPSRSHADCGCTERHCDCHCECCVCDADVLVHARCGEVRRIPVTFENDTRREKPVTLELGKFVTAGGRDLEWSAALSETSIKLRPCGEATVFLTVRITCQRNGDEQGEDRPNEGERPTQGGANPSAAAAVDTRFGSVDRCEVGYATIRAEGCLTRPIVVAVAVLPDDCDTYRHPCGCGCCH
jgi:hypothetical protein